MAMANEKTMANATPGIANAIVIVALILSGLVLVG